MAEEVLDAITKATNVPITYNISGGGTTTSAMKLPDTIEVRNNVNIQASVFENATVQRRSA